MRTESFTARTIAAPGRRSFGDPADHGVDRVEAQQVLVPRPGWLLVGDLPDGRASEQTIVEGRGHGAGRTVRIPVRSFREARAIRDRTVDLGEQDVRRAAGRVEPRRPLDVDVNPDRTAPRALLSAVCVVLGTGRWLLVAVVPGRDGSQVSAGPYVVVLVVCAALIRVLVGGHPFVVGAMPPHPRS
jgi:hypothetical protein